MEVHPFARSIGSGFLHAFTGKSAGCPAFLPVGRGGEKSRPCNYIYITPKPRPVGGELHSYFLKSLDP
jgi:hypothetical protein